MLTRAQQFTELFRAECSEKELKVFTKQYMVSKGVFCSSKSVTGYSMIFADGSVWGYGMIFERDAFERGDYGYSPIVKYQTMYCQ